MKVSQLIEILSKSRYNGDEKVRIETKTVGGVIVEQDIFEVLSVNGRVILISEEALYGDPLLDLPPFPNVSLVSKDGLPE